MACEIRCRRNAAFEFANEPLELLDGANLLALLAEYANLVAKSSRPTTGATPLQTRQRAALRRVCIAVR